MNSVAALPAPKWSVNLGQGIETEYPLHMISREGGPSSVGGLLESVPAEKYKILELNLPALILTVTSGTDWLAWPPSSSGARGLQLKKISLTNIFVEVLALKLLC